MSNLERFLSKAEWQKHWQTIKYNIEAQGFGVGKLISLNSGSYSSSYQSLEPASNDIEELPSCLSVSLHTLIVHQWLCLSAFDEDLWHKGQSVEATVLDVNCRFLGHSAVCNICVNSSLLTLDKTWYYNVTRLFSMCKVHTIFGVREQRFPGDSANDIS